MKAAVTILAITLFLVSFSPTRARESDAGIQKNDGVKKDVDTNREEVSEEFLIQVMEQCNETYRVDMSYMVALNESGSFPDETDRIPKCNVRCFLMQTGVSSEDGDFDSARAALVYADMRPGISRDDVEDMAKACAKIRKEKCKCERSYQFVKCLKEKQIKKYEKSA